jgi:hypothetical protein
MMGCLRDPGGKDLRSLCVVNKELDGQRYRLQSGNKVLLKGKGKYRQEVILKSIQPGGTEACIIVQKNNL